MLLTCASALKKTDELKSYAAKALNLAKRRVSLNPHDFIAVGIIAQASYFLGDLVEARHWTTIVSAFDIDDRYYIYNIACLHSQLGSIDESLDALERSLSYQTTDYDLHYIRVIDPDLELVRKDPRFDELLARYESQMLDQPDK